MPGNAQPSKRRRAARLVLAAAILLPAAAILAGLFGRYAEPLDSLAHFRAHLAVLMLPLLVAAAALRLPALVLAGLVAAVPGLATTYAYLLPEAATVQAAGETGARYRLLQMNLLFEAPDKPEAIRRIAETQPDVVTVQEVTAEWRALFDQIRDRYPYQFHCRGPHSFFYSAILSRRPFTAGDQGVCRPGQGFAARSIDFNGVPISVASIHLGWPWPSEQWSDIRSLRPVLEAIPAPLLVAGDFNAAPWSAAVASVADASGTTPAAGIGPSWIKRGVPPALARYVGLPLDNILASDDLDIVAIERLRATSSDHLPLLLTFSHPFAPPDEPEVQVVAR